MRHNIFCLKWKAKLTKHFFFKLIDKNLLQSSSFKNINTSLKTKHGIKNNLSRNIYLTSKTFISA